MEDRRGARRNTAHRSPASWGTLYELTQPPVEVFNKRMTGLPGTWQSVDDDPVAPFGATDTPAPVPPVSPAVISDDSGASTEPDLNAALSGMAMLLHVALRLMKA